MTQNIPADFNFTQAQRQFVEELLRRISDLEARVAALEAP